MSCAPARCGRGGQRGRARPRSARHHLEDGTLVLEYQPHCVSGGPEATPTSLQRAERNLTEGWNLNPRPFALFEVIRW